MGKCNL